MLVPEVLQLSTGPGDLTLVLSTRRDMVVTSLTEFSVPGHQMLHSTVGSTPRYGSIQSGLKSVERNVLVRFADVFMIMTNNYCDLIYNL